MTGNQIGGAVCMALGAFGGWLAIRAIMRRRALLRNPVRAKAEVIRLELATTGDSDDPDWYVPTVRFTSNGQDVEAKLESTNDEKTFAVGRTVSVQYQKGVPRNVCVSSRSDSGKVTRWIAVTLAALLFLFGALLVSGKYGFRLAPSEAPADAR